jgi:hypothetical protein
MATAFGLGNRLQSCRDVRRLAEREALRGVALADLADDDESGMDAEARLDGGQAIRPSGGPAGAKRGHDVESRLHGAARVVLVGLRIAEVDEQAIAQVLRNLAFEAANDLGAAALVLSHDRARVLGIEPGGQRRRSDQITEHHGELTALALGGELRYEDGLALWAGTVWVDAGSGVPQPPQNRSLGSLRKPQDGQVPASDAPHAPQKRRPSRLSALHRGHCTVIPHDQ